MIERKNIATNFQLFFDNFLSYSAKLSFIFVYVTEPWAQVFISKSMHQQREGKGDLSLVCDLSA